MCAPHVLDLAQHVGLVLLSRSMVTVLLLLLVIVYEVVWTVVSVLDVRKFGHDTTCDLVPLEQR